jgi:hypothetical protein
MQLTSSWRRILTVTIIIAELLPGLVLSTAVEPCCMPAVVLC